MATTEKKKVPMIAEESIKLWEVHRKYMEYQALKTLISNLEENRRDDERDLGWAENQYQKATSAWKANGKSEDLKTAWDMARVECQFLRKRIADNKDTVSMVMGERDNAHDLAIQAAMGFRVSETSLPHHTPITELGLLSTVHFIESVTKMKAEWRMGAVIRSNKNRKSFADCAKAFNIQYTIPLRKTRASGKKKMKPDVATGVDIVAVADDVLPPSGGGAVADDVLPPVGGGAVADDVLPPAGGGAVADDVLPPAGAGAVAVTVAVLTPAGAVVDDFLPSAGAVAVDVLPPTSVDDEIVKKANIIWSKMTKEERAPYLQKRGALVKNTVAKSTGQKFTPKVPSPFMMFVEEFKKRVAADNASVTVGGQAVGQKRKKSMNDSTGHDSDKSATEVSHEEGSSESGEPADDDSDKSKSEVSDEEAVGSSETGETADDD